MLQLEFSPVRHCYRDIFALYTILQGSVRGDKPGAGWKESHAPLARGARSRACLHMGRAKNKSQYSFSELGIPSSVAQGMSKEGMRAANPDQADIISRILKGSSILVVCPEIVESLYYLRSSLCCATLAKVDTYIPSIQIILLTPTDNLARTLYRPLKGYGRFCEKIGAKLCLDDIASVVSDEEAAATEYSISSRSQRVGEHILVGTPKAVLAHLKATEQLKSHISMMGICHAQDVFETFQHNETLAELTRGLCVNQVVVCAACEHTITAPCDAMFPRHNMQKVVPYASSNTLDSPLSGENPSGSFQSSPAQRKQPNQVQVPSSMRPCDSPTPEAFSPVASHGGHAWEHHNATICGWASPPCWGSPRTWAVPRSSTCTPNAGLGSLTEAVRQLHGNQESQNNNNMLHHFKSRAQQHTHYPVAPASIGKKSGAAKLRTKRASLPASSTKTQSRQQERSNARRCNLLRRMLSDVLPVGYMPSVPLVRYLPADLYGALGPGEAESGKGCTAYQSKEFAGVVSLHDMHGHVVRIRMTSGSLDKHYQYVEQLLQKSRQGKEQQVQTAKESEGTARHEAPAESLCEGLCNGSALASNMVHNGSCQVVDASSLRIGPPSAETGVLQPCSKQLQCSNAGSAHSAPSQQHLDRVDTMQLAAMKSHVASEHDASVNARSPRSPPPFPELSRYHEQGLNIGGWDGWQSKQGQEKCCNRYEGQLHWCGNRPHGDADGMGVPVVSMRGHDSHSITYPEQPGGQMSSWMSLHPQFTNLSMPRHSHSRCDTVPMFHPQLGFPDNHTLQKWLESSARLGHGAGICATEARGCDHVTHKSLESSSHRHRGPVVRGPSLVELEQLSAAVRSWQMGNKEESRNLEKHEVAVDEDSQIVRHQGSGLEPSISAPEPPALNRSGSSENGICRSTNTGSSFSLKPLVHFKALPFNVSTDGAASSQHSAKAPPPAQPPPPPQPPFLSHAQPVVMLHNKPSVSYGRGTPRTSINPDELHQQVKALSALNLGRSQATCYSDRHLNDATPFNQANNDETNVQQCEVEPNLDTSDNGMGISGEFSAMSFNANGTSGQGPCMAPVTQDSISDEVLPQLETPIRDRSTLVGTCGEPATHTLQEEVCVTPVSHSPIGQESRQQFMESFEVPELELAEDLANACASCM